MKKKKKGQRKKKRRGLPGGFILPPALGLGFAIVAALVGSVDIPEETEGEPAKELPPPADDLTLNPETGAYE